jgi:hypothetical protein
MQAIFERVDSLRWRFRLVYGAIVHGALVAALGLLAALMVGCSSRAEPEVYRNAEGFRFTPPPGWVERARDDALSVRTARPQRTLPLPPLATPGSPKPERLLVRYDRLTAGYLAWLRVTVADRVPAASLEASLSTHKPGRNWRQEAAAETLEVGGLPAARIAFAGRWDNQDYLCETVAVSQGERVYFITASFPAADAAARDEVRQAVANAAPGSH